MDYASTRFAENGYHTTSVAEIVQGMGVGKGVFYWYFSSKEELFLEILREAQYDLRKRQQAEIGDAVDPVERLESGIRASMAWLAENRSLMTLFQFSAAEERFRGTLHKGQDIAVSDIVRHVKEGMAAGQIRDTNPLVLAHAILGVTNHMARIFIFERDEDPASVADAAVNFCRHGLLGDL